MPFPNYLVCFANVTAVGVSWPEENSGNRETLPVVTRLVKLPELGEQDGVDVQRWRSSSSTCNGERVLYGTELLRSNFLPPVAQPHSSAMLGRWAAAPCGGEASADATRRMRRSRVARFRRNIMQLFKYKFWLWGRFCHPFLAG